MAYIVGFGAYLPSRVVSNEELAARLGCEAGWILDASGIAERRYAGEAEGVADMAVKAAEDCLKRAGWPVSEVRLLIVATGSAPQRFPGPASEVAHRLGLDQVPGLDVPAASAGSLIGMILGNALAPAYGTVLVVAAEKMSSIVGLEPPDRNTAILFGDGAGACLLSSERGAARIVDHVLHSDGAFAAALKLGTEGTLSMDGRSVILQASRKLPRAITELLERQQMAAGAVSVFLMHQANQNLMDGVARALRVPAERFFSNIRRYGNTSSASMFVAAADWQAAGGFRTGEAAVFAAFGAGFHWGAVLTVA